MTLYTQVAANRIKTGVYLVLYMLLVVLVGYAISWYYQSPGILMIAGVIAIVQGGVSWWFSDSIALMTAHAEPLDEKQYDSVYKIVDTLVVTAGLPMPRLYLIPDNAINAFATGRDRNHAALAITQGCLDRLDKNELTGVLAHELCHIGDDDIRLLSMVMVMAGLIALLSDFFMRSLWWGGGRRRNNDDSGNIMMILVIAAAILAPIAATLMQLAISRKREFMADQNGVLLTRYPEGLISALRKIAGDEEPLEVANRASAPMYFANPLKGGWLAGLFDTHPPIEERIKALEEGSGMHSEE
jgi:heat shock protein HtpX